MIPDDVRLDLARGHGDSGLDAALSGRGRDAWRLVASRDATVAGWAEPPLPSWACPHRLRSAQHFAARYLPFVTVGLFCAALPMSYTSVPGARVLTAAGGLARDIDRRINNTAAFVLDVLTPGGFDLGGTARRAVGKVRLTHAAVRATLAEDPRWLDEPGEVPINQEDTLGAQCLFSVIVVRAMQRLGVTVDAHDREDFVHLWAVVGAMLGLDDDLRFESWDEATVTCNRIAARQMRGSPAGHALMAELLDGMRRHVPLPGLRELPAHLSWTLLGARRAGQLGLERPPASKLATYSGALAASGPMRAALVRFGGGLVEAIQRAKTRALRPTRTARAQLSGR